MIVGDGRQGLYLSVRFLYYIGLLLIRLCQRWQVFSYLSIQSYIIFTGPYDAIHVGAAAPTLPKPLVDQLASPGRMFIPVGTHSQRIIQVDKDAQGKVTEKDLMGVVVSFFFFFRVDLVLTFWSMYL